MNGIIVTNDVNLKADYMLDKYSYIKYNDWDFIYKPLNKFKRDKLFFENNEIIVLLDGVILNKFDLINKFKLGGWKETFIHLYKKDKTGFINILRGPFRGVILDKNNNILLTFTNQTGEKAFFYTQLGGKLFIASHNDFIVEYLKKKKIKYSLNLVGVNQLLTVGYMLNNNTPINDCFRITAGCYLHFDFSKMVVRIVRYHLFSSFPQNTLSLDDSIEQFDILYRNAIKRIFSKNQEYGYKHIIDLSGGLDSRMINFVANELGYKDITSICYSQTGSADNKISKKISKYLGHTYIFEPLDRGEFLHDIDKLTALHGGQVVYFISTGAYGLFSKLDMSNFGISTMGTFASNINALLTESDIHTSPNLTNIRYSKIIDIDVPKAYFDGFKTFEEFNTYGFNTHLINDSMIVRQNFTEAFSPMSDVDVAEFLGKMPISYRKSRIILKKWIVEKYPKASKYLWQHSMKPLSKENKFYFPKAIFDCKKIFIKFFNKILRILGIRYAILAKDEMNPFDEWYNTTLSLRNFIHEYYDKNFYLIKDEELKIDIEKLFNTESSIDKLLVINILSILKRYFK